MGFYRVNQASVQVTLVRGTRKVNCILAHAKSEKPNELTLERNLRLITKQRKIFLTPSRFLRGCHAKKRVLNRFFGIRDFPHLKLGIRDCMKFWVGITGVKHPIGDPLRMKACFLRVSITDPPSLTVLENFILTHIFLTQCLYS